LRTKDKFDSLLSPVFLLGDDGRQREK